MFVTVSTSRYACVRLRECHVREIRIFYTMSAHFACFIFQLLYIYIFFCSFVSSYERSAALLFHLCCSSIGICRPSCSYYIVLCVHAHAASSPLLCAGWTCAYGMHACMHVSVCCMLLLFASWALCMNAFRCICYARAYNDKDQKTNSFASASSSACVHASVESTTLLLLCWISIPYSVNAGNCSIPELHCISHMHVTNLFPLHFIRINSSLLIHFIDISSTASVLMLCHKEQNSKQTKKKHKIANGTNLSSDSIDRWWTIYIFVVVYC